MTSLVTKRVLVTGARGFLGSNVAVRLSQLGAEVYGIARHATQNREGIRFLTADLRDIDALRTLLKDIRPDVIIHLAGQAAASPDAELVLSSFYDNLATTVHVLSEAVLLGCSRVVITGSLEEPDYSDGDVVPSSPYAASKWATVVYGRMFHKLYQLPVVIVRPFMTYGPGQGDTKIIPYVALSLLRGAVPTIGQGDRRVDWIHIDDVVEGIVAAAQVTGVEGYTIDLGSGVLIGIREVIEELVSVVGTGIEPRFRPSSTTLALDGRAAKITDAFKLLGWKPTTSLRKGLEQTVAWYRRRLTGTSLCKSEVMSPERSVS